MRKSLVLVVLAATLGLSACSTRLNPLNWFGRSQEVSLGDTKQTNPLLPEKSTSMLRKQAASKYTGTPVSQVVELKVEKVPGGAMIRALGLTMSQRAYAAKLQPRNDGLPEKGVLTYDFLAIQPSGAPVGGPKSTRELSVAHVLTNQQLAGVRTIKVVGQSNARQARR